MAAAGNEARQRTSSPHACRPGLCMFLLLPPENSSSTYQRPSPHRNHSTPFLSESVLVNLCFNVANVFIPFFHFRYRVQFNTFDRSFLLLLSSQFYTPFRSLMSRRAAFSQKSTAVVARFDFEYSLRRHEPTTTVQKQLLTFADTLTVQTIQISPHARRQES